MNAAGHETVETTLEDFGAQVYPVPAAGEDVVDVEVRIPLDPDHLDAFYPTDVIRALRETNLLARTGSEGYTVGGPGPQLRFTGFLPGQVWMEPGGRRTTPNVMLFEDTKVLENGSMY